MDFTVRMVGNGEELSFLTPLPPELASYQVFPTAIAVRGSWGAIIFQTLRTPEFPIWYCNYLIKEDCSFLITANIETIGLHVAFKNSFNFDIEGLGNVKVREGQFNITYMPRVNTVAHFTKGEYATFDISYPKDYFTRFIPHLSNLEPFLFNTGRRIAGHLSPIHSYATHQMMQVIKDVLTEEYNNDLSQLYIDYKASELLLLAIKRMGKEERKVFVLNSTDVECLVTIKAWLLINVDQPGTISELARRFGINEYKLKRGFRELFGTAIFEFIFSIRMEKAKKMLLETDLPVTEIAYRAGYSKGSHFSDAFKRHFNVYPNYLRKK